MTLQQTFEVYNHAWDMGCPCKIRKLSEDNYIVVKTELNSDDKICRRVGKLIHKALKRVR